MYATPKRELNRKYILELYQSFFIRSTFTEPHKELFWLEIKLILYFVNNIDLCYLDILFYSWNLKTHFQIHNQLIQVIIFTLPRLES